MSDVYRVRIEMQHRRIVEDRHEGANRVMVVELDGPAVACWLQGLTELNGKAGSTSLRAVRIGWKGGLSFE
jgi:hypothetical protein